MALSKTAKYYRDNPKAREKHRKSSTKWNRTEKGKKYKKAHNALPETKAKTASRKAARRKVEAKLGRKLSAIEHVDHKNKNAKDNSSSNLRAVSAKMNVRRNKK